MPFCSDKQSHESLLKLTYSKFVCIKIEKYEEAQKYSLFCNEAKALGIPWIELLLQQVV